MSTRLAGLLAFLTVGFALVASAQEHTKDSLDTVKKALAAKKAVLLDVREKSEWDDGHLRDASLLPLSLLKKDKLSKNLDDLIPKGKIAYLHCRAGGRALLAAEILKKKGYDVRPLADGYESLVEKGFPKVEKAKSPK